MTDTQMSGDLMVAPSFRVLQQQDFRIFRRQGAERPADVRALFCGEEPLRWIRRPIVMFINLHPLLVSLGEFSSPAALTAVEKNLVY